MFNTECPSCGEKIHLKNKPKIGQRIFCPSCGVGLRVISENPLAVTLAGQEWIEPVKVQRDQLHPSRVKHQKDLYEDFEDDEFDGEPGLDPKRGGKKRSKNKKRRLVPRQLKFDEEDF